MLRPSVLAVGSSPIIHELKELVEEHLAAEMVIVATATEAHLELCRKVFDTMLLADGVPFTSHMKDAARAQDCFVVALVEASKPFPAMKPAPDVALLFQRTPEGVNGLLQALGLIPGEGHFSGRARMRTPLPN